MKYKLNEKTKEVTEEVVGTFTQMPLKLAWAITIHKSQGLTFERAIIDAEAAFAHGQVYVALSRCKSFEGIVLRSPISTSSVRTDRVVERYSEEADRNAPDENHLEQSKQQYQQSLLLGLFDFKMAKDYLAQWNRVLLEHERSIQGEAATQLKKLMDQTQTAVFEIAEKFSLRLKQYFSEPVLPEQNEALQDRIKGASTYFTNQLKNELLPATQSIHILSDNQAIKKMANEKQEGLVKVLFTKNACFEVCLNGFMTDEYIRAKANADLDFQKAKQKAPKVKKAVVTSAHPILNERLIKWRKEKAADLDFPLYRVLTTRSLLGIIDSLPSNVKVLKIIHGLGKKKVEEFGEEIIEIVNDYCSEKEVAIDLRNQFSDADIAKLTKKKKPANTKKVSFDLYQSGKSVLEIAKERGFTQSTIESHLAYYVGLGVLTISDFVKMEKVKKLEAFFMEISGRSAGEAKKYFGATVTYSDIKMVMALVKGRGTRML